MSTKLYVLSASNEAEIRSAAQILSGLGGGSVMLPPGVIPITAALPLYANVAYIGCGLNATMGPPNLVSGVTVIDGQNLGVNGFEYNPTDRGSAYATRTLLQASEIPGVEIRNIGIVNCKNGIKAGALYEGGCHAMRIDRVAAYNCSEWGMWLENCHNLSIGQVIIYNCGIGQFMSTCSGTSLWAYGNDNIEQVISQQASGSLKTRGICIGSRASSQRNDVLVGHLTSIGGGASYTIAPTCTNGVADLGVTDLSKFALNIPVIFQTTGSGFTLNKAYFVVAMSGSTGAGTIQVATAIGGTAVTATATGSAPTLVTKGGAAIELGGAEVGSFMQNCVIGLTDTETCGAVDVYLFKTYGIRITMGTMTPNNSTYQNQICCRSCDYRTRIYALNKVGSYDADSSASNLDGITYIARAGSDAHGLRYNTVYSGLELWLDARGKAWYPPDTTLVLNHIGSDRAVADKATYIASGATIDQSHGSHVIYTGTGGGNITLPAIFLQAVGVRYRIVNPSSGTLTVNTSSSQTINNAAGVTSITVAANSCVMVTASQTSAASGVFFWAKL